MFSIHVRVCILYFIPHYIHAPLRTYSFGSHFYEDKLQRIWPYSDQVELWWRARSFWGIAFSYISINSPPFSPIAYPLGQSGNMRRYTTWAFVNFVKYIISSDYPRVLEMSYWTNVFFALGVGLYELRNLAFPDIEGVLACWRVEGGQGDETRQSASKGCKILWRK